MDVGTCTSTAPAPSASGRVWLPSLIGGAVLALASWALARTVEHDRQLATLAEDRAGAVLSAQLGDVRQRLERLEHQLDTVLQRLPR